MLQRREDAVGVTLSFASTIPVSWLGFLPQAILAFHLSRICGLVPDVSDKTRDEKTLTCLSAGHRNILCMPNTLSRCLYEIPRGASNPEVLINAVLFPLSFDSACAARQKFIKNSVKTLKGSKKG